MALDSVFDDVSVSALEAIAVAERAVCAHEGVDRVIASGVTRVTERAREVWHVFTDTDHLILLLHVLGVIPEARHALGFGKTAEVFFADLHVLCERHSMHDISDEAFVHAARELYTRHAGT